MRSAKRILAALIVLAFALSLLAPAVLAKGSRGGGRGGGFSSGGRSSFSSSAKSSPTSTKSYTSTSSGYTSHPTSPSPAPSGGAASNSPSSAAGGAATNPYGKGYTTGTGDFSTPRSASPPLLAKDYQTGKTDYNTGANSYTTGRTSYNGTWNRGLAPGSDRYPQREEVRIFGSPAGSPYEYHNNYWSSPWWYHLLFRPSYYHTSWGYGYYQPNVLAWLVLLVCLGVAGYLLYRYINRKGAT